MGTGEAIGNWQIEVPSRTKKVDRGQFLDNVVGVWVMKNGGGSVG